MSNFIKYGDIFQLNNGMSNWEGYYLAVMNKAGSKGQSSVQSLWTEIAKKNKDEASEYNWEILPAHDSSKSIGDVVCGGDKVTLSVTDKDKTVRYLVVDPIDNNFVMAIKQRPANNTLTTWVIAGHTALKGNEAAGTEVKKLQYGAADFLIFYWESDLTLALGSDPIPGQDKKYKDVARAIPMPNITCWWHAINTENTNTGKTDPNTHSVHSNTGPGKHGDHGDHSHTVHSNTGPGKHGDHGDHSHTVHSNTGPGKHGDHGDHSHTVHSNTGPGKHGDHGDHSHTVHSNTGPGKHGDHGDHSHTVHSNTGPGKHGDHGDHSHTVHSNTGPGKHGDHGDHSHTVHSNTGPGKHGDHGDHSHTVHSNTGPGKHGDHSHTVHSNTGPGKHGDHSHTVHS
ncbi:hypothetical protein ACGVWS_11525, partial [Enterobacteriaceae bacterium LUAb1]